MATKTGSTTLDEGAEEKRRRRGPRPWPEPLGGLDADVDGIHGVVELKEDAGAEISG